MNFSAWKPSIFNWKTQYPIIYFHKLVFVKQNLERETGLEPATYSLEGCHSTNWAIPAFVKTTAGRPVF